MHLDKQHPRPVYLQLKELLQNQIEQGVYLCHQQLPSERDLCQYHNLSRMTVRRALQQLIAEGFAYTRAGKGTFVNQKPNIFNGTRSNNSSWATTEVNNKTFPFHHYWQRLMTPLLSFDCVGAERVISEALAAHSLEIVAGNLFLKTIRNIEQKWHQGEVSLLVHNYAITTVRSQLIAMVNAATMFEAGPRVILACAPGDQHELGLLLLALSLRRRGFVVIYLGPNLNADEFYQAIDEAQPELVCVSAATDNSIQNLVELTDRCRSKLILERDLKKESYNQKPLFTFGGVAFSQNPVCVSNISGRYLGSTVEEAVITVQEILM